MYSFPNIETYRPYHHFFLEQQKTKPHKTLSKREKEKEEIMMSLRALFFARPSVRSLHTSSALFEEKAGELSRLTGSVKWFNVAKGYGFLTSSEGNDVFVHYNAIQSKGFRSLREGETVEFEVGGRERVCPLGKILMLLPFFCLHVFFQIVDAFFLFLFSRLP